MLVTDDQEQLSLKTGKACKNTMCSVSKLAVSLQKITYILLIN